MVRLPKTTFGWWATLIINIAFVCTLIFFSVSDLMYYSAAGLVITDVGFFGILTFLAVWHIVQYEIWPLADHKPWEKKDEHEDNSV